MSVLLRSLQSAKYVEHPSGWTEKPENARHFGGAMDAVVYEPGTDTISERIELSSPRAHHEATLLPDGTVVVSGGYSLVSNGSYDEARPEGEVLLWVASAPKRRGARH